MGFFLLHLTLFPLSFSLGLVARNQRRQLGKSTSSSGKSTSGKSSGGKSGRTGSHGGTVHGWTYSSGYMGCLGMSEDEQTYVTSQNPTPDCDYVVHTTSTENGVVSSSSNNNNAQGYVILCRGVVTSESPPSFPDIIFLLSL